MNKWLLVILLGMSFSALSQERPVIASNEQFEFIFDKTHTAAHTCITNVTVATTKQSPINMNDKEITTLTRKIDLSCTAVFAGLMLMAESKAITLTDYVGVNDKRLKENQEMLAALRMFTELVKKTGRQPFPNFVQAQAVFGRNI